MTSRRFRLGLRRLGFAGQAVVGEAPPPSITLVSHTGGETLYAGRSYTFSGTCVGCSSGAVDFNGTAIDIDPSPSGGSFSITCVPPVSVVGASGTLRVTGTTSGADVTDTVTLTIAEPTAATLAASSSSLRKEFDSRTGWNAGTGTWTSLAGGYTFSDATSPPTATTSVQTGYQALGFAKASTNRLVSGDAVAFAGNDKAHSVLIVFEASENIDGAAFDTLWCVGGATATQPYHLIRWSGSQDYPLMQRRADGGGGVVTPNPTAHANMFARGAIYALFACFEDNGGGTGTTRAQMWVNRIKVHDNAALNTTGTATLDRVTLGAQNLAGAFSAPCSMRLLRYVEWNNSQSANWAEIFDELVWPLYFEPQVPGATVVATDAATKAATNNTIVREPLKTSLDDSVQRFAFWDHETARLRTAYRTVTPGVKATGPFALGATLDRSTPLADSHHVIALGYDSAGKQFAALDMHNDVLRMTESNTAGLMDFTALGSVPYVAGSTVESSVTYPRFRERSGRLSLYYRNGSSGNGNEHIIAKDSGAWFSVAQLNETVAANLSPYFNHFFVEPSGREHASWTYRSNSSNNNIDIYYAYSDDGVSWFDQYGAAITLPFDATTLPAAIVLGGEAGLINNQTMVVDQFGRPVVICHYDQGTNDTQLCAHVMVSPGTWVKTVLTSWTTPYHFDVNTPAGMDAARASRPAAVIGSTWRIRTIYVHTDDGPGIQCLTFTVALSGACTVVGTKEIYSEPVGLWEPNWDRNRWNRDAILSMDIMYQPFTMSNAVGSIDPIDANALPSAIGIREWYEVELDP